MYVDYDVFETCGEYVGRIVYHTDFDPRSLSTIREALESAGFDKRTHYAIFKGASSCIKGACYADLAVAAD